jgi:hypothetical protein
MMPVDRLIVNENHPVFFENRASSGPADDQELVIVPAVLHLSAHRHPR